MPLSFISFESVCLSQTTFYLNMFISIYLSIYLSFYISFSLFIYLYFVTVSLIEFSVYQLTLIFSVLAHLNISQSTTCFVPNVFTPSFNLCLSFTSLILSSYISLYFLLFCFFLFSIFILPVFLLSSHFSSFFYFFSLFLIVLFFFFTLHLLLYILIHRHLGSIGHPVRFKLALHHDEEPYYLLSSAKIFWTRSQKWKTH